MLLVFGFGLLVLSAGMVVLFAMLGELAGRVGASGSGRSTVVRHVEDVALGRAPDTWPAELAVLNGNRRAVVLVLSSACSSCVDVAEQLAGHPDWPGLGVVVSTSATEIGEEFLRQHPIDRPRSIDVGGEWVAGQFGVQSSPVALVFADGVLDSAYEFNDVAALRAEIVRHHSEPAWAEKEEV